MENKGHPRFRSRGLGVHTVVLVTALIIAALTVGCERCSKSDAFVAVESREAVDSDSARFHFTQQLVFEGDKRSETRHARFSGVVDFANGRGYLSGTCDAPRIMFSTDSVRESGVDESAHDASTVSVSYKQRWVHGVLYGKYAGRAVKGTPATIWGSIGTEELMKHGGADILTLLPSPLLQSILGQLGGNISDAAEGGDSTYSYGGVDHIATSVQPRIYWKNAPSYFWSRATKVPPDSVELEVWTSGTSNRVTKYVAVERWEGDMTVRTVVEYSRYGLPVDVSPPALRAGREV